MKPSRVETYDTRCRNAHEPAHNEERTIFSAPFESKHVRHTYIYVEAVELAKRHNQPAAGSQRWAGPPSALVPP